jgi:predicted RNase H-like HicB family nuclease
MELKVILEPQIEGGFTVHVPSLPGCVSQGETREEALANIKEAIELYLDAGLDETITFEGEVLQVAVRSSPLSAGLRRFAACSGQDSLRPVSVAVTCGLRSERPTIRSS